MENKRVTMVMNLLMILLSTTPFSSVAIPMAVPPAVALPGCRVKCGNVTISYPFGVKEGCYKDLGYQITCEARNDSTFKPYLGDNEVLDISLSQAHVKVKGRFYASQCFNAGGNITEALRYTYNLSQSPFRFSASRNKLIVIGCDTIGYISEYEDKDYTSGCASLCRSRESVENGSCLGIGCCQSSIPFGLKSFEVRLASFRNHTLIWDYNPCSFAFVADKDWFTFNSSDLSSLTFNRSNIPVVLDWAIGNQTCKQAPHDACGPNSFCSNSTNGPGYRCYCNHGFEGNPYIGCKDINECTMGSNLPCHRNAKCENTEGGYSCSCPRGYNGNGFLNGTRCIKSSADIIAGVVAVSLILSASSWTLNCRLKIKQTLRIKLFRRNGGTLLEQQKDCKIFTLKELNKATNNFNESRIQGQGGFGTVYKGILSGGKTIAIKKSKMKDQSQIIQFINEVHIISQINHRHVVKLLGCCLETDVPILVYEFISNGTLFQHIHSENRETSLSWENRLRIAVEAADALAYVHSSHPVPIFHRDVKSSNILLDDEYKAKVSDLGASRLVPLDQTQEMTVTQVTHGYLDPEYCLTGQLTDKSDVYSFGIVLVELLTAKKPLLSEGSKERKTLAKYFVSSVKDEKDDENLFGILDDRIRNDGKREEFLAVAKLARKCLEDKGENRPTMKKVAKKLLKRLPMQPSLQRYQAQEETGLSMQPSLQHKKAQGETQLSVGLPSTSLIATSLEILEI